MLILDLDETLIYASRTPLARPADFTVFSYHVYKRPGLKDFLQRMHEAYTLAIWSSASDAYVEAIAQQIIPSHFKLAFVWARSRCVQKRNLYIDDSGYYQEEQYAHYHFLKPLKKVKRLGYSLERMLIVDDTPHKVQQNYGNAIYPQPYHGSTEDDELLLLAEYLEKLKDKQNLRSIEKRNWRRNMINQR